MPRDLYYILSMPSYKISNIPTYNILKCHNLLNFLFGSLDYTKWTLRKSDH